MKRHRWKRGKRLTALFLATLMVVTSITLVPKQEVQAGIATEWIFEATKDYVERAICYGLEAASDEMDGESPTINVVLRLIKSPEENKLDEVEEMCEEILDTLEDIETEIVAINEQLNHIETKLDKLNVQSQLDTMAEFQALYESPVKNYSNLVKAAKAYAENPTTENYNQMESYYDEVQDFYNKMKKTEGSKEDDIIDDIIKYGHATSKYVLSDEIEEEGTWKSSAGDDLVKMTYLGAIAEYYKGTVASQPMMYEALRSNLNKQAYQIYYYLQSVQIYTIMRVNEINTDKSLTRSDKEKKIENQWKRFEKAKNRAGNLINQISYEARNDLKIDTYMRSYDMVPTKVTMGYIYSLDDIKKTKETMGYSILKLTNGATYAIYTEGAGNENLTLGDMLVENRKPLGGTETETSDDYLNLNYGKGAWEGFELIYDSGELGDLTKYNSYSSQAGEKLWDYLRTTEQVPNLVYPYEWNEKNKTDVLIQPFYGITRHRKWSANPYGDMILYVYELESVQSQTPKNAMKEIDLEDDVVDEHLQNKPIGLIMKQKEETEIPLTLSIPPVSGVSVKVENLDKTNNSGNPTVVRGDKDGNYTIAAGDRITIKVSINDTTKEISSAELKGEVSADVGEESWAVMDTYVSENDTKDFTSFRDEDNSGYHVLASFPMLYRNSKIEIKTKENTTPATYLAELNQPETGVKNLQFAGMPGIEQQVNGAGSEVKVVVWPEGNQIAKGLTITNKDGVVLTDVAVTEMDSNQAGLPEEAKTYTFAMPESNITISADLENGYMATLKNAKDGELSFADENGQTLEYSTNEAAYHAGERVYVKGIASTDSYYCSNIQVNCKESGTHVRVRMEDEGVSFIMPEEDVLIAGEFEKKDGNYEVAVSTTYLKKTANGTVTTENGETASKIYSKAGEKVTLIVKPEEGSWMDSYSVKRKGSGDEILSQCETTQENLGFQSITFIMPAQNVGVEVAFDSDTFATYTGTLRVDAGLKGKLAEIKSEEETEILNDVTNGQVSFTASELCSYKLVVDATYEGAVPKVSYNGNVLTETKDGEQYIYSFQVDAKDFEVVVENVGEKEEQIDDKQYDYLIPDYETMCFYWDKMGSGGGNYCEASYLITEDIVAPDTATTEDLRDIYQFAGVLNGGGHKVTGLKLKSGLFSSSMNAVIKNLELEDVTVGSNESTGLAGTFSRYIDNNTAILNCKVTGQSVVYGSEIGGITGSLDAPDVTGSSAGGAVIENCGVNATLICTGTNKNYAGGISGTCRGAIENCYFAGKIEISDQSRNATNQVGGINGGCVTQGSQIDQRGYVWNCYVQDGFAGWTSEDNVKAYDISPFLTNMDKTYIPSETYNELPSKSDHIRVPVVDNSLKVSRMRTETFAIKLNDNLEDPSSFVLNRKTLYKDPEVGVYKTWKWSGSQNNGYPYFEEPEVREAHSVKIESVPENASLEVTNGYAKNENVYRCLDGQKVTLEGTTESEKVQIVIKNESTGDIILKTECEKDADGKVSTEFIMPAADVEVTMTESENHGGKINVDTDVIPAEKAELSIQDAQGNAISEAAMTETIYLNPDQIEKGYEISKFIFKSSVSLKPYKTIDAKDTLQEDGRYVVTLSGSEDILRGKVTIYAVLQKKSYSVSTSVTPENSGTIEVSTTSAKAGDEVTYTITPATENDSCKSLLLCDEAGNILKTLNCTKNKGTFTMPAENVVLKATFKGGTYEITTKNSDNLTLNVVDETGNGVKFAQSGETITVHYSKNAWTAYEMISVYKADEYESGNAEPINSWTARKSSDSNEETPFTFTMPRQDVVIVAEALPEGDYNISKEIEGNGNVYVRDMVSGNKKTANEGELIFASAFAEKGWSLVDDRVKVYGENDNEIEVTERDKFVTFKMPTENLKVKATFVENEYAITIEQPEQGTISVTDKDGNAADLTKVHYGDKLKIKVTGADKMKSVHYVETGVENASALNISLNDNYEAEFTMPDKNITIRGGHMIETDENGTYLITTFEDLKQAVEIVKENPVANFKLMNTIFGDGETMTESIGSAENPYNGTFDGQGYYIYRFDIKSSDGNAALFDTIGAQGSVKNFGAFYQNIEGEKAAGLAIVNYGLIDECISGSNLSGMFNDRLTDERKNLSETTTFIKGTSMAGGVVVENKGMIRNTANYATATASASDGIVGGIAAVNSGTIENCMSIGALSTKENGIAGGIVGKLDKNGSIQIAYSAQTAIEGGTTGAVFGTKEESAGAVKNAYYLDSLSGNEEQGTAKTKAEMQSNSFKEELNTLVAGNKELCSWTWNSTKNQGYPRILSSLVTEVELVNASRGFTVKGMMYKDTKLQLNELDKKNNIYQAFKKYAEKTDKQVLYSAEPTLVYADGQPAPYEGNLNVKLDLSKYRGKGYKVLVYRNNQIEELEIDKQMIASKDVEEMVPFAVLAEKSGISKAVDHIKNIVKTGDNSSLLLLFGIAVVAGIVAGGVIYWRKKKAKK